MPIYSILEQNAMQTADLLGLSGELPSIGESLNFFHPRFENIRITGNKDGSFEFNLKYPLPPKVPIRKQIRHWLKKMLGRVISTCTFIQNKL